MYGPLARIIIRYGVGAYLGSEVGDMLAGDADLVNAVALAIGALNEALYVYAKKNGWTT